MARTMQTLKATQVTGSTTPPAQDEVADRLARITTHNMVERKIGSIKLNLPKPLDGSESNAVSAIVYHKTKNEVEQARLSPAAKLSKTGYVMGNSHIGDTAIK